MTGSVRTFRDIPNKHLAHCTLIGVSSQGRSRNGEQIDAVTGDFEKRKIGANIMSTRTYGANPDAWLGEEFDLRRRRQASLSGTLVRRAHWLAPDDRELILAAFQDGRKAVAIAQMLNQDPRLVRRRLKRLALRLQDPRVAYVMTHQQHWSRTRRTVARQLFIMGRSMRQITRELGVSIHCVRTHRDAIEAMCAESVSQRAPRTNNQSAPARDWRTATRGR